MYPLFPDRKICELDAWRGSEKPRSRTGIVLSGSGHPQVLVERHVKPPTHGVSPLLLPRNSLISGIIYGIHKSYSIKKRVINWFTKSTRYQLIDCFTLIFLRSASTSNFVFIVDNIFVCLFVILFLFWFLFMVYVFIWRHSLSNVKQQYRRKWWQ